MTGSFSVFLVGLNVRIYSNILLSYLFVVINWYLIDIIYFKGLKQDTSLSRVL